MKFTLSREKDESMLFFIYCEMKEVHFFGGFHEQKKKLIGR